MPATKTLQPVYAGILLAILASFIWSGNFVVARAVAGKISPVSLAFFRWLTASLILLPFAGPGLRSQWPRIRSSFWYLLTVAFFGIAVFNTLLYQAGHFTSAINLALIGTTSSPVMSIILAAIFLKERLPFLRIVGLLICLAGILLLVSRGDWHNLRTFHFGRGDGWIFAAAFCFAVYNVLVRRKPAGISGMQFLLLAFGLGTLLLFPAYLYDQQVNPAPQWTGSLLLIILYLGLGTSVLAYLCWNAAIARLGAGRTALFGNLIPVFSSVEAVWLLQESFSSLHLAGSILVIGGLILANLRKRKAAA